MDKFLRFFIKFHSYCIAIVSSILTVLFTWIFSSRVHHDSVTELYNLRYTGIPSLVFGIAWMTANALLIVGIYQEKKSFLYPFSVLFLLDLFLVILRDAYLLIFDYTWFYMVFLNVSLPFMIFIVPYVILSMLALMRLFDLDPVVRTDDSFVRFDRNPAYEETQDEVGPVGNV
ncbi:uncharacterized protein LOC129768761 [Toxorhynchites rutilus septentrionalis]|uniref:uncharacterized protein LOC129768761 n=1 Tax=Toxorhynchites rutilus septentrionalis TaxID=329112 RepID=UPI002479EE9B|nr:uncharacterized protein LOC129768761 [Toxorhynchites rutilus septentrionalis]